MGGAGQRRAAQLNASVLGHPQGLLLAGLTLLLCWMLGAGRRLRGLHGGVASAFAPLVEALQQRTQAVPLLAAALRLRLPAERNTLLVLLMALQQHEAALRTARAQVFSGQAMARLLAAEGELAAALLRIQALLERHPEHAAGEDVRVALAGLHEADGRITQARQRFNDAVLAYNDARTLFPASLLARALGLGQAAAL